MRNLELAIEVMAEKNPAYGKTMEDKIKELATDASWLKYILIPLIIPGYELSKLFNIKSMLDLFDNSYSQTSSDGSETLSLELTTHDPNVKYLGNAAGLISQLMKMVITYLEYKVFILEEGDDDGTSLRKITLSDIKSEVIQMLINLGKFAFGLVGHLYSLEADKGAFIDEDKKYYAITSYSLDFVKSILELLHSEPEGH